MESQSLFPSRNGRNTLVKDWKPLLILLMFSFFLLLVLSPDGWWRIETYRNDTSWFMMAGKSWMSGLLPYRDFSDSKGPLLWLIYGLGWLISPHNFHGVFFFEVLAYWLSFYFLYKTSILFLHNIGNSLIATCLISFFYFYPGVHQEMRAEDFCHVFQSFMLFTVVKVFYFNEFKKVYFFGIGITLASTLLIKYSYFFTLLVPLVALTAYSIKQRIPPRTLCIFLIYLSIGFLLIFLPFTIYFLIKGIFNDFIHEYFFSTGETIFKIWNDNGNLSLRERWPFVLIRYYRPIGYFPEYMRLVLLCLILTVCLLRKNKYLVLTIIVWYAASVLLYSINGGERYFMTLSVFAFGGLILLIKPLNKLSIPFSIISASLIIAIQAIFSTSYIYGGLYYSTRDLQALNIKKKVETIINSAENRIGRYPTLVYLNTWEKGEHINTNAVAGTKYWAPQYGMTEQMESEYYNDIFTKTPDFIIICIEEKELIKKLKDTGYVEMLEYQPWPPFDGPEWTFLLLEYKSNLLLNAT